MILFHQSLFVFFLSIVIVYLLACMLPSPLTLTHTHTHTQSAVGAVVVDPSSNRIVTQAHTDSSHPLKHAVMVCIDNVARQQGGGTWIGKSNLSSLAAFTQSKATHCSTGTSSTEREKLTETSIPGRQSPEGSPPAKRLKEERQYLCSSYDLYTTKEPCVM